MVDISPVSYLERSATSRISANHAKMIDAMLELDLKNYETREDVSRALSVQIGSGRIRMFLLKNLTRNEEKGFSWKINLPVLKKSLPAIMENIALDSVEKEGGIRGFGVLFIRGEDSDYIAPEDHHRISKLFPTAEIVSIPNSGHWVHAEQPELFVKSIKYFLA